MDSHGTDFIVDQPNFHIFLSITSKSFTLHPNGKKTRVSLFVYINSTL